jgi:hypothetical protein
MVDSAEAFERASGVYADTKADNIVSALKVCGKIPELNCYVILRNLVRAAWIDGYNECTTEHIERIDEELKRLGEK